MNQPTMNQPTNYWTMDEASACEAGEHDYISETGLYECVIERAEYIRASTGSHGMLVRFKSGERKGSFIINYSKANGEKLYGADFINAMLYLADLRGFAWQQAYNEKNQLIQVAKEFEGRHLGFFLRAEQGQNGKNNLNLQRVYHPKSRHTVSEIRAGKQAEAIQKIAAALNAA